MRCFLKNVILSVMIVAFGVQSASASILVTCPTPTLSFDTQGDSDNVKVIWTSTIPRFRLGDSLNTPTGELHSLTANTIPRHARIRMTCSRYPGVFNDFQLFNNNAPYTTIPVTASFFGITGGLSFQEILPGDTLSFEFYQSTNFLNNAADAEWNNLSINVATYEPVIPSAEDLGILTNGIVAKTDTLGPAQVKWYKFRVLTDTMASRFLDIDTAASVNIPNRDTSVGLYDEEGFLLATNSFGYSQSGALSFAIPQAWNGRSAIIPTGNIANGENGTIPAGTYYLAVAIGNQIFIGNGFRVTSNSSTSGPVVTTFNKGVDSGPVWPPTFTDLGPITASDSISLHTPLISGRWVRFSVPAIASPAWLDIHTEYTTEFLGASAFSVNNNDTFLSLFDVNGSVIVSDSLGGTVARAMLSFGDSVFRGSYIQEGFVSHARNGYSGNLAAGTYYLYVGGDLTRPSASYPGAVPTNSACSGPIVVNFEFAPPTKRTINVTTDPMGWTGTKDLIYFWELLSGPGGAVLESGFATADTSGTVNVQVDTMSGTGYVLTLQGSHWLKIGRENLNLNANVSPATFVLVNGDVDRDNEIGPGDFAEISSAFGSVPGDGNWNFFADLDGDEEVGPSDFSIISSNFGLVGY